MYVHTSIYTRKSVNLLKKKSSKTFRRLEIVKILVPTWAVGLHNTCVRAFQKLQPFLIAGAILNYFIVQTFSPHRTNPTPAPVPPLNYSPFRHSVLMGIMFEFWHVHFRLLFFMAFVYTFYTSCTTQNTKFPTLFPQNISKGHGLWRGAFNFIFDLL